MAKFQVNINITQKKLIAIAIIGFMFSISTAGAIIVSATGTPVIMKTVIEPGSMTAQASYIVFKDAVGVTCIKNGTSGAIDYRDSNSSKVINQAILNLPSVGGMIYLASANYSLTSSILISRNFVTIQGEQTSQPYPNQGGAKLTKMGDFDMIKVVSSAANRLSAIKISDISLGNYGSKGNGITISNTSDVEISKVYTSSFTGYSIYGFSVYAPYIHDCWFAKDGSVGIPAIAIVGQPSFSTRSTAVRIMNNNFEDIIYGAVSLSNCDSAQLTQNFAEQVTSTIQYYFYVNCSWATIDSNKFFGATGSMIVLGSLAISAVITNNYFGSPSQYAIDTRLTAGTIINNNIIEAGKVGVMLSSRNIVTDNKIYYQQHEGINISGYQNVISNNQITTTGQSGIGIRAGIFIYSGFKNSITGNQIYDDGSTMSYWCQEVSPAEYNTYENNVLRGTVGKMLVAGDSLIRNNLGYVTQNFGLASIASGNSSVTVTTGLSTGCVVALINPDNALGHEYYISYSGNNFIVYLNSSAGTNWDFRWSAYGTNQQDYNFFP